MLRNLAGHLACKAPECKPTPAGSAFVARPHSPQEGTVKNLVVAIFQFGLRQKQLMVTLLKYGLGIVLLAWVVGHYWEPSEIGQGRQVPGLAAALQKPISYLPLTIALVVYLSGILITFLRWYILVRAQDLPFTVTAALRLGLIGFYLSTFLPGSVGGDIIKAAFIARQQSRRTVAVATVVVDRFIGLCGLFCLVAIVGGFACLVGYIDYLAKDSEGVAFLNTIVLTALAVSFGSLAAWFVAGFVPAPAAERLARGLERIYKVGGSMAELWRALYMYRRRGHAVLMGVVMSIAGHICFVLAFYFSSLTLNSEASIPTPVAHFLLVPVGMTISSAVPTPGGVGGAEMAFAFLYSLAGYDAANGVLASLVQRIVTWVLGLMGYLVYLRMKPALETVVHSQPVTRKPLGARQPVVE
jgi:uncharacterized protein (TIRG00374 family)